MRFLGGLLAAFAALTIASGPVSAQEVNLLALGEGALPVVEAPSYSGWTAANMIDDAPGSGWACPLGKLSNNVFVFELPVPGTAGRFEFDTGSIDGAGRGARDVVVEVSAVSMDAGFEPVLKATLADKKDGQSFPVSKKLEGRFFRLTIVDNHGDEKYSELMGFRGYGTRAAAPPPRRRSSGPSTRTTTSSTSASRGRRFPAATSGRRGSSPARSRGG